MPDKPSADLNKFLKQNDGINEVIYAIICNHRADETAIVQQSIKLAHRIGLSMKNALDRKAEEVRLECAKTVKSQASKTSRADEDIPDEKESAYEQGVFDACVDASSAILSQGRVKV